MKPVLCFTIAASIALTAVTMPALQANATEDSSGDHSAAWNLGYADALAGKFDNDPTSTDPTKVKVFKPPYDQQADPVNYTDYICGFIAGKSMRGK